MMQTEAMWRRAGIGLGKHWKLVLVAVAVVTLLLLWGLSRIEFATGQDSYLNPDSQVAIDNVVYQEQFGGETVILLFTGEEGRDVTDLFSGDNLDELERITAELEEVDQAYSVITPLVSIQFSDALLQGPGRNALLDAASRDPDPAGREERAADVQVSLARLGAVTDQAIGNPEWADLLVYGNNGFTLVDGEPVAPPDDELAIRLSLASTFPERDVAVGGVVLLGNASLQDLSDGTDAILEILDTAEFDGFELTTTGTPVYLKEINDYLQGGMLTLGLAALAVMAVILLVMFRVRWRLLPLLPVLVGVVWAFAILGYIGIDLSLVTISGLPILIGLGIDFAIQVHNRVEEEVVLDREVHPMAETLSNVGPALVAATVGSVLAFLALQISQVPMIRDFGILLAIGVAVLLVTGIILPTAILGIREWRGRTKTRGPSRVERIVVWLGSLPPRVAPVLVVLAVGLFAVGIAVEGQVKIESDPVRWIDQDSEAVQDIEALEEATGFGTTLGVLVEANNVLADEVNELLWDWTLDAEQRPLIVSSSSLVNTMGKIILEPGGTVLTPTSADLEGAVDVAPEAIRRALINEDHTATQVNLRIAPASLEERAVLVAELEADLQARIDALDVPPDSVLLVDLAPGTDPVRAVPSGLAVVGVGLLDNLTANRAILTYLGLTIVGLWFLLRTRSLARTLLALVPVSLAVGASSIIIGAFDLTVSPLTTVSGPLVIATCAEFSILMLVRYLEEREHGLDARAAGDKAASRTGRAFFTSAATTIGGFAVLIGSALPLLRDFGIIVTMNVAVALLAALVVLPPLVMWADGRGWIAIAPETGAVRIASHDRRQAIGAAAAAVILAVVAVGLVIAADTDSGESEELAYTAVELPTPTPAPTPTPQEESSAIDASTFGTERPDGLVGGTLYDLMTASGVDPQLAVCTTETLLSRVSQGDLLAAGLATFEPEAVEPVVEAALDCGVTEEQIEATLEAATSG